MRERIVKDLENLIKKDVRKTKVRGELVDEENEAGQATGTEKRVSLLRGVRAEAMCCCVCAKQCFVAEHFLFCDLK